MPMSISSSTCGERTVSLGRDRIVLKYAQHFQSLVTSRGRKQPCPSWLVMVVPMVVPVVVQAAQVSYATTSRKDPSSHQRQGVTGRNGQPTAFMRKDRRD